MPHGELELLIQVFQSLRDLIPPDLQQRLREALRELLLAIRALIDWYLERIEQRRAGASRGPGHPDPVSRRGLQSGRGPNLDPHVVAGDRTATRADQPGERRIGNGRSRRMSGDSAAPTAASERLRRGSAGPRMAHVPHERRLAAYAAIGLFLALFLPWYQETVIVVRTATHLQSASASITGWGAFSFVEAAVLLVAAGVLTLLFQRAEGRAFHLPGGDGWVIMAAGVWTCVLIVWRIFDKQGTSVHGPGATTSGIEWGIFVALGVAALPHLRRLADPRRPSARAAAARGAATRRRLRLRQMRAAPELRRVAAPASPGPSPRRRRPSATARAADAPPRARTARLEDPPASEDRTTRPDAAYEPPPARRPIAPDVVPDETPRRRPCRG